MEVYNLTIFCILFSACLHMTSSLPAERNTEDKLNEREDKKSFLSEYLTSLGEGGNNDQSTTELYSVSSQSAITSRTLIDENPTLLPPRQVQAPAVQQVQLTGADAIEDAISLALSIAKAQDKTTTVRTPKRKPPSTARSPHEFSLPGANNNRNRIPAAPYPTAIYTDPISLLGVPTTKDPWINQNPNILGVSQQQSQFPAQNVQIDPAVMQNYLSLMSPEDLLALQAYQYQDQLNGQLNPSLPVGLVPAAIPVADAVTSTTEATPGEYLAGFFGSLAAANLGGMADNAFKLFASRHVQGFLTGLADQVTCQLGKNCKSPKVSHDGTQNATSALHTGTNLLKEV